MVRISILVQWKRFNLVTLDKKKALEFLTKNGGRGDQIEQNY
jgi:hypothetical protein